MFLGIDLGTSDIKVLLLDTRGKTVALERASLTIERPAPLWSEQDPHAWWRVLDSVMQRLKVAVPDKLRQVEGIGLSGQMHGAVLLDASGAVLRPAILWNDGRSVIQCQKLLDAVPDLVAIAGNIPMPGFTAPKLLWVKENEPNLFARTARVLLPKDFLRLQMTGEAVTDCSDASGTLWMDVAKRRWSPTLLAACDMSIDQMPRIVEGSEPGGTLTTNIAQRWGLRPGIVVAGGGGDNAASAIGVGALEPGQGFVSLGTSGVIFAVTAGLVTNTARATHAFCHALPKRWHEMSVMLSAASCLKWVSRLTAVRNEDVLAESAAQLNSKARMEAPIFLPYLSGERTPHNNAEAKGVLFGLTHEHDAAAVAYSVLEGVSFGMRDGLLALQISKSPATLELVGGGSKSNAWAQLLATVLDVRLRVTTGNEAAAALGAARLGWCAAGGDPHEVASTAEGPSVTYLPDPDAWDLLRSRYRRFGELYTAVNPAFNDREVPI